MNLKSWILLIKCHCWESIYIYIYIFYIYVNSFMNFFSYLDKNWLRSFLYLFWFPLNTTIYVPLYHANIPQRFSVSFTYLSNSYVSLFHSFGLFHIAPPHTGGHSWHWPKLVRCSCNLLWWSLRSWNHAYVLKLNFFFSL
jgi:hypothetical protein